MTIWTGTLPNFTNGPPLDATDLNTMVDALQGLSDPWTPYTPVWTATGTAVALGNGTIVGKTWQANKTVVAAGRLTFGSTTTGGTGIWAITIPVLAADVNCVGSALAFHSTGSALSGTCNFRSTGTLQFFGIPATGLAGQWSATVPITWASGDFLQWQVMYEAA